MKKLSNAIPPTPTLTPQDHTMASGREQCKTPKTLKMSLNKKKLSNFAYFCVTFLFFTCFNLYFSNLISYKLLNGLEFTSPLFNLVLTKNTGAAFSIMQNSTAFLIALSLIGFLAILYFVIKDLKTLRMKEILFISFLMAGILGNLYERAFLGYVRDFFELAFVNFPIFNISDIFINIGVIGIATLILLSRKSNKSNIK